MITVRRAETDAEAKHLLERAGGLCPAALRRSEGVEVVTLAERPELLEAAYPLACEG
jgi:hypothetical protein